MRVTPPASNADYGSHIAPSPTVSGGPGGGAPTDASYVTLSSNATLSAESVLTAGAGVEVTTGGGTATVSAAAVMWLLV